MTPEFVIDMGRRAMEVTLMLSAPMLLLGLIAGLAVSIFQAVTQINEMTLTFIPKLIAIFLGLILFLPWMLQVITEYTAGIFVNIPNYIK
jgi:flagellar biosynthetic protein FliQ